MTLIAAVPAPDGPDPDPPPRVVPHRPRTAFVLGGGGNLGSIQVGMLRALAAHGERPDMVLGSSVGSLNGVAVASDPSPEGIERLRRIWIALGSQDVFPSSRASGPWLLLRKVPSLYANSGLCRLIDECAEFAHFEDAPVPFEVVATNLRTGRAHWFDRGPIRSAILASAALPAAFPPVTVRGETYIDGGVVDNVPITRALHHGAERIIVLHVGNFDRPRPLPKRPIDVLLQSFSIARNHRFALDVERVPANVELIVLPSIDPGNVKRSDFTRTSELIERSCAAAAAYLDLRAAGRLASA